MIRFMKKSTADIFTFRATERANVCRNCWEAVLAPNLTVPNCTLCSDMDGLGSPDSMMEQQHNPMLELKNSSHYSCYPGSKLPYDVFSSAHQRGQLVFQCYLATSQNSLIDSGIYLKTIFIAGLPLKTESLWHFNQNYQNYNSVGYSIPASPGLAATNAI